jgi:hypothetical protein
MKTSIITLSVLAFAVSASNVSAVEVTGTASENLSVSAVNTSASANANVNATVKVKAVSASSSTSTKDNSKASTSTSSPKDAKNATSTGTTTASENRSVVANFVQSLLKVANRQPGIGAEVRAIAQAQNDSASTTEEAVVKTEARSGVKAFLVGTDYKNLGVIRSELAKTDKRIARLQEIANDTFNLNDRATLNAEIEALTNSQAKLRKFVADNEVKFSVFGWFTKLFQKE